MDHDKDKNKVVKKQTVTTETVFQPFEGTVDEIEVIKSSKADES